MPGTNADNKIPIPLDADPVKNGALATRNVVVNVPALRMGGSPWGTALTLPGKPPIIVCFHQTLTSNQYGQINLAHGLNTVCGIWVTGVSSAIIFDIDGSNPPGAGNAIIRLWNPANPAALLPNRAQEFTAVVIGQP